MMPRANLLAAPPAQAASTLHLPPGEWSTVLDCLCAHFPSVSPAEWLGRMQRGRVLDARGAALPPHSAYRAGLCVRYFREVAQEPEIPFEENLLHVDEHLVVADKPHFLPVIPAGRYVRQTLLSRLVQRLGNPHLVPLHRIDRGTAGLVLFSANPATRAAYQALFQPRAAAQGRLRKTYHALAPALAQADAGAFTRRSRIVAGEPFFRMREVEGEPNSETHIQMQPGGGEQRLYRLQPVTGRKHQLRVHLAALGVPIVNDPFYPTLLDAADDDPARPLMLLAQGLSFSDPLTGAQRDFQSARSLPVPA